MNREKVREYWNGQATDPRYQVAFAHGMLIKDGAIARHRKEVEERRFQQLVTLSPNWEILDIGCGAGRWSLYFAERAQRVIATDLSDEMIRICNVELQKLPLSNISFHVRDATAIDGFGKFDLIHAGGVLQYLADDEIVALARDICHTLKPDGLFLSRDSVTHQRIELHGDYTVTYRTPSQMRELHGAGGLRCIASITAYVMPTLVPKVNEVVPLRGLPLDIAIRCDGAIFRSWIGRIVVKGYHMATGRGCGEVPDHRYFLYKRA